MNFFIILVLIACALIPVAPKSREDVMQFIQSDDTQREEFSPGAFDCVQFSKSLIESAAEDGFEGVVVGVGWNEGDTLILHAFVQFNTADGPVWIEPQNDNEYIVVKGGQSLCTVEGECITEELRLVYIYK